MKLFDGTFNAVYTGISDSVEHVLVTFELEDYSYPLRLEMMKTEGVWEALRLNYGPDNYEYYCVCGTSYHLDYTATVNCQKRYELKERLSKILFNHAEFMSWLDSAGVEDKIEV
jgi:hypothetical protein